MCFCCAVKDAYNFLKIDQIECEYYINYVYKYLGKSTVHYYHSKRIYIYVNADEINQMEYYWPSIINLKSVLHRTHDNALLRCVLRM